MTPSADNSEFAIHNRKEIVFILNELAKERAAINLDTQEGVGLLTSVLKVSSEGNYVQLNVSPDNRINDKIINSKKVNFSAQKRVKVCWHSPHLQRVSLPDSDAFSMALPSVIERIQRREYFRLSTPQGRGALICKIPDEQNIIEANIVDMSAGGVRVSIKGNLPANFSHGTQLAGCSIALPGVGIIPVGVRICRVWDSINTSNCMESSGVGMEFVNLSRGAGNAVQRYMIELEQEQINIVIKK